MFSNMLRNRPFITIDLYRYIQIYDDYKLRENTTQNDIKYCENIGYVYESSQHGIKLRHEIKNGTSYRYTNYLLNIVRYTDDYFLIEISHQHFDKDKYPALARYGGKTYYIIDSIETLPELLESIISKYS